MTRVRLPTKFSWWLIATGRNPSPPLKQRSDNKARRAATLGATAPAAHADNRLEGT